MALSDGSVWVVRCIRPYEGEELKGVYTSAGRALQAHARVDAEVTEVPLDAAPAVIPA